MNRTQTIPPQLEPLALELDLARRISKLGPDMREAVDAFVAKAEAGHAKYGTLDLATDVRDFGREIVDELIDAVAYQRFEIIKLKRRVRELETGSTVAITYAVTEVTP